VIRRIEVADWERLRDVRLRALAVDSHAFLVSLEVARELPEEHWRDRATPTETQVTFVEERDGVFTAVVASFVSNDPATAYLVGIWVAPEARRTGVAVRLVEHVLDWAREHRRTRVVLSVKRGNEPAARLYAKCGFVEIAQPVELPYEPTADTQFYARGVACNPEGGSR
jgi:ribosomal protein S18 acetylase RimI-like enzyme